MRQNMIRIFLEKKRPLRENADTAEKIFTHFFIFRERNLYVSQIFMSQNQISHKEKDLFLDTFSWWSTMESFQSTMESSQSTIESSQSTIVSSQSIEPSQSTIESSQSTIQQKYKENGRILHNLAFESSKSIKIEHGPAISIDCLDLYHK